MRRVVIVVLVLAWAVIIGEMLAQFIAGPNSP